MLRGEVLTYQRELDRKEEELAELRNRPPVVVPAHSNTCKYVMSMVAIVVGVVTLAYIFLWRTEPKVSPI